MVLQDSTNRTAPKAQEQALDEFYPTSSTDSMQPIWHQDDFYNVTSTGSGGNGGGGGSSNMGSTMQGLKPDDGTSCMSAMVSSACYASPSPTKSEDLNRMLSPLNDLKVEELQDMEDEYNESNQNNLISPYAQQHDL